MKTAPPTLKKKKESVLMERFFDKASWQNHPLRALDNFLKQEQRNELAENLDALRFVGYVLEINYSTVTIITSDPFKIAVGGIPRNSLLIMLPDNFEKLPLHFTLLRVLEAAPTPLSKEVQQTYFELQKKSMPELDVFTQSELQWGALKTGVLGMFYPHPEKTNAIEYSGDMNNFVSAHRYRVYAPDDDLLKLIVNSLVPPENRFSIGKLRQTECRFPLPGKPLLDVAVQVSTTDFMGTRTAMFGKTRLGKSNVVKLIVQSLIETTTETKNVGQIIFDVNGEYANDNPQNQAIATAYPERCIVYALTRKSKTPSRPLRLDFYEHPESSLKILSTLLAQAGKSSSIYVSAFLSANIPSIEEVRALPESEERRARRKILMYWAVLHRAGFKANFAKLRRLLSIDPGFNEKARTAAYGSDKSKWPEINSLDALAEEFEKLAEANRPTPLPSSTRGKNLFDPEDTAILGFLKPSSTASAGPVIIKEFTKYHDPDAGNFVEEIVLALKEGQTVILDLGNAPPELVTYFSEYLSKAIFAHQVTRFSDNELGNHYIQLYFEEAHNLFPSRDEDTVDIYRRLAKEGAKYQIGMVYSTQSVTTISKDLLGQTENFFIAHLSSQDEVNALAKVQVAYDSLKDDILMAKTPGYIRMLTRSHRFVVSMQANKFEAPARSK
jgi:hypothetical protein